MFHVLGLDIGGANTKATYIKSDKNNIMDISVVTRYFPIWKKGKDKLIDVLKGIIREFYVKDFNLVVATMTAELSDVYFSKREGVIHVVSVLESIFQKDKIKILSVDGDIISTNEVKETPLKVAAANWYATGWLVSKISKNCLVVDVGSTTTSIIPILDGEVAAIGKNDLEKLMYGELVYTGALRTNVAAIVQYIPYRGVNVPVSSEYFAQSGDVHLILGNINEEDYTVDTPDGRGTTFKEAAARIARVLCADLEMISMDDIYSIAKYIYNKQVEQICKGITRLLQKMRANLRNYPAYVTGLGGNFLAKKALMRCGFNDIRMLSNYIGKKAAIATPSYAVALMGLEQLVGDIKIG